VALWKGLPDTNTVAYYEHPEIKAIKSLIRFDSGAICAADGAQKICVNKSYNFVLNKKILRYFN
jgi:hypothetical protein